MHEKKNLKMPACYNWVYYFLGLLELFFNFTTDFDVMAIKPFLLAKARWLDLFREMILYLNGELMKAYVLKSFCND